MFKKMPNTSNLLYTMLVVVLFSSCEKVTKKLELEKQQPEIELVLGKKYITSFDWEEKDPFKVTEIDTVTITGLKNGYVEWEYKNGMKQSCKARIFRLLLRHNH